ncbi:hypothetical protein EJ08DRAFT_652622 [Tothia fuscella]|uniref:Uncharacterized protein n=1 Tax=Tothia fuscella TaxID=1048955 RepID=A0A9P4NJJ4_9PEZI|nr:hypothetical protein EJ08DRAFT_652622 [Tothia fuscella]
MLSTPPRRLATTLSGTGSPPHSFHPILLKPFRTDRVQKTIRKKAERLQLQRKDVLAAKFTKVLQGAKTDTAEVREWNRVDNPRNANKPLLRTILVPAPDRVTELQSRDIQGLLVRLPKTYAKEELELVQPFNHFMKQAARALYNESLRKSVFYWFWKIKKQCPTILKLIPKATWLRLWKMHVAFRPLSNSRLAGIGRLMEAMEIAGVDTTNERAIFALETLSAKGKHEEAIASWDLQFETTAEGQPRQKDWLEAGTRLYAAAGDLDGACHALDLIIKSHQSTDPRFIFFLIWRHVELGGAKRILKAWYLYTKLKKHPTFSLTADDYSSVFKCFLQKKHKRAALQILSDLVKDTTLLDPPRRAPTLVCCIHDLHESCKTTEDVNAISLELLRILPKEVNLSSFFLSWLQNSHRIQGFDSSKTNRKTQATDTCAQIIELMFESGHDPDPRHMNELMRVWFDMEEKTEDAEAMAWSMINKRMHLVEEEKKAALASPDSNSMLNAQGVTEVETQRIPQFLLRPVPPAVATTFTHLASHYARSQQPDYASYVLNLLGSTNLYLSSQSLRSILAMQFTLHEFAESWTFLQKIRTQDHKSMNMAVYNTLWKGCYLHTKYMRDVFKAKQVINPWKDNEVETRYIRKARRKLREGEYPEPRVLFADMMTFIEKRYTSPSTANISIARTTSQTHDKIIPEPFYNRIIGTCLYRGDPLSAYVAIQTLHTNFNITPTPKTIDIILYYTSLEAQKSERKSGIDEHISYYKKMGRGVLEYLYVNDGFHKGKKGKVRVQDFWGRRFAEKEGGVLVGILLSYLKILMVKYWASEEVVDGYLGNAREMMGVKAPALLSPDVTKGLVDGVEDGSTSSGIAAPVLDEKRVKILEKRVRRNQEKKMIKKKDKWIVTRIREEGRRKKKRAGSGSGTPPLAPLDQTTIGFDRGSTS